MTPQTKEHCLLDWSSSLYKTLAPGKEKGCMLTCSELVHRDGLHGVHQRRAPEQPDRPWVYLRNSATSVSTMLLWQEVQGGTRSPMQARLVAVIPCLNATHSCMAANRDAVIPPG